MQYKLIPYNISDLQAMPSTMNSAVAAIAHEIELDLDSKSIRTDLSDQFRQVFEEHHWEMDSNLYFEPARKRTLHYIKNRILALALEKDKSISKQNLPVYEGDICKWEEELFQIKICEKK